MNTRKFFNSCMEFHLRVETVADFKVRASPDMIRSAIDSYDRAIYLCDITLYLLKTFREDTGRLLKELRDE